MLRYVISMLLILAVSPILALEEKTVSISEFAFAPATLQVKAGVKVKFVNKDEAPHNIVIDALKKRTRALDTNEQLEIVFDKPGEYLYFCGLHPQMTGRIVVDP